VLYKRVKLLGPSCHIKPLLPTRLDLIPFSPIANWEKSLQSTAHARGAFEVTEDEGSHELAPLEERAAILQKTTRPEKAKRDDEGNALTFASKSSS
jgi:hypothetical protein